MRELRRDARVVVVDELRALLGLRHGHHEVAAAKAEVQELVDVLARLEEHVLADDADVGGTVLDVRRHVSRLRDDEADLLLLVRDDEFARLIRETFRRVARLGQKVGREREELAFRQGDGQVIHGVFHIPSPDILFRI